MHGALLNLQELELEAADADAGMGDAEEADRAAEYNRARGGTAEFDGSIDDLVQLLAGGDIDGAAFMAAHGVEYSEDEALLDMAGDGEDERRWSDAELDQPVHDHTDTTVRELVYTILKIAAGRVNKQTLDELIKAFAETLPPDHKMPRCALVATSCLCRGIFRT